MDLPWIALLTGGIAGALTGAIASIFTATRIARSAEKGKAQEAAQQRVLARIRSYRSAVASARPVTGERLSQAKDPLQDHAGMAFAEDLFRDAVSMSRPAQKRLRRRLVTLVGDWPTATAEDLAHQPVEDRPFNWRADAVVRLADSIPDGKVLGKGLVGIANGYEATRHDVVPVVDELRELELDLTQDWIRRTARMVRHVVRRSIAALDRAVRAFRQK